MRVLQVDSRNLVGISLCVFVKTRIEESVTDIYGTTVGVGVFGVMVRRRRRRLPLRCDALWLMGRALFACRATRAQQPFA